MSGSCQTRKRLCRISTTYWSGSPLWLVDTFACQTRFTSEHDIGHGFLSVDELFPMVSTELSLRLVDVYFTRTECLLVHLEDFLVDLFIRSCSERHSMDSDVRRCSTAFEKSLFQSDRCEIQHRLSSLQSTLHYLQSVSSLGISRLHVIADLLLLRVRSFSATRSILVLRSMFELLSESRGDHYSIALHRL